MKARKLKYDEHGIRAIIALQAKAGIEEPRRKAEEGWLSMTPAEREQTMIAYETICIATPKRTRARRRCRA